MDRSIIYTPELPRTYDLLKGWRRAFKGLAGVTGTLLGGWQSSGAAGYDLVLGQGSLAGMASFGTIQPAGFTSAPPITASVVNGFRISTSASTMVVTFDVGEIYCSTLVDGVGNALPAGSQTLTSDGDLSADGSVVVGQFIAPLTTLAFTAPAAGSYWYGVYAIPSQAQTTDSDDPNLQSGNSNAVLPYYNSSNTSVPYAGPNGNGVQQASNFSASAVVMATAAMSTTSVALGTTSGSPGITPIALPTGAVALFYVQVIAHTTNSNAFNIYACGRGTPLTGSAPFTSAPVAPFLNGMLGQHHLGVAGSAPQIDGAVEWKPSAAVPNNTQQITGVAQGGLAALSLAGATHLSDVLTVGQMLTVPGYVAAGTAPGGMPTYTPTLSNLTYPSGSSVWTTVTALASSYATLSFSGGSLLVQAISLVISLPTGTYNVGTYTLTMTLPMSFYSSAGSPILAFAISSAGGGGLEGILVQNAIATTTTVSFVFTFTNTLTITSGSDAQALSVLTIGQNR